MFAKEGEEMMREGSGHSRRRGWPQSCVCQLRVRFASPRPRLVPRLDSRSWDTTDTAQVSFALAQHETLEVPASPIRTCAQPALIAPLPTARSAMLKSCLRIHSARRLVIGRDTRGGTLTSRCSMATHGRWNMFMA